MDPISAAASIVTLAGIASKSCQALVSFFRGISKAKEDIIHLCKTIESLEATLQCIISLCFEPGLRRYLTKNFMTILTECLSELKAADQRCHKVEESTHKGKMQSTWAKLKWYSLSEYWLADFFLHVQSYQTILSLEISTLQTKLLLRSQPCNSAIGLRCQLEQHNRISRLSVSSGESNGPVQRHADDEGISTSIDEVSRRTLPETPNKIDGNVSISVDQTVPHCTREQDSAIGIRFAQFIKSYSEPFAIRSQKMGNFRPFVGSICYWHGPMLFRMWTEKGEEVFGVKSQCSAYGTRVTVRLPTIWSRTLSLIVHFQTQTRRLESLSIRWFLSFPSIVSRNSQIIKSTETGDIERTIRMFEAKEAAYSDTTPDGTSLLHIAVRESHKQLMKYLLECGADSNAVDDDGDTPLHFALQRSNDSNLARILIEKGADICNRNNEGKTPLHTFFRDINRDLLTNCRAEAETTHADDRGMQLFHYIAWSSKSTVADFQSFLNGHNLDRYSKDAQGRSVLFFVAERGNLAIMNYILNWPDQPRLSDVDVDGMSLMHYAVRSRRVQAIDLLCQHQCSTQTVDRNQQNALHHAVKRKNIEAVKRLLAIDGSKLVGRRAIRGRTPLDLALMSDEIALIASLRSVLPEQHNIADEKPNVLLDLEIEASRILIRTWTSWLHGIATPSKIWRIILSAIMFTLLLYRGSESPSGGHDEVQPPNGG